MEKRAKSIEMHSASRNWKNHGNRFSNRAHQSNAALPKSDFNLRPIVDFWSAELLDNICVLFEATKIVVICYRSNRKSVQFSSVAQSCPTLCDPMNHSTPGLPVHHQLPEFTQTHVHWVSDAIQPSHPLSSPSPPSPNPSQHQSLFQWVNSSHEVAKVLEFQL